MTPRRAGGFTLLEMMVVLAILGMVAAMASAGGMRHRNTLGARAIADDIAAALRGARTEAILRDRPTAFALDLAAHSFQAGNAPPRILPSSLRLSMLTVTGETVGGTRGGIVFMPDGSSSGGRIDLDDGARRIDIGIDWLTGRISIADAR